MLKIELKKVDTQPKVEIIPYNSVTRIPLSLNIGVYKSMPSIIYANNQNGENFIEFRFDKENQNLYEISLVAIQNTTVKSVSNEAVYETNESYLCKINQDESLLEDMLPMEFLRDQNSLIINLDVSQNQVKYFAIAKDCYIGVNDKSYLASIFLDNLLEKDIFDIFGW